MAHIRRQHRAAEDNQAADEQRGQRGLTAAALADQSDLQTVVLRWNRAEKRQVSITAINVVRR
jgi:hypothetical protein